MNNLSKELVQRLFQEYRLPLNGIHGVSHWARVWENGTLIARSNGSNVAVVQLFALFHDAKRRNEGHDPDHGYRGAEYAKSLRQIFLLNLSDQEFDLLYTACVYHTDGLVKHDPTVQACWDADRLDLNRVGILPEPAKLCTDAAKSPDMLTWANERAANRIMPEFAITLWDIL